jgi:hypothetical protein
MVSSTSAITPIGLVLSGPIAMLASSGSVFASTFYIVKKGAAENAGAENGKAESKAQRAGEGDTGHAAQTNAETKRYLNEQSNKPANRRRRRQLPTERLGHPHHSHRHALSLLGRTPRLVAADAACYCNKNEAAAKAKGVKRLCIPNRSTKSAERKREQKKALVPQLARNGAPAVRAASAWSNADMASTGAVTGASSECSAGSASV